MVGVPPSRVPNDRSVARRWLSTVGTAVCGMMTVAALGIVVGLASMTSTGCSQTEDLRMPPKPKPPEVFFVKGTSPLHRNRFGEDLPVVVRIYHLTDTKNFEEAAEDFRALWTAPRDTLGDQMVGEAPQSIRVEGEDPDANPRVIQFDPPVAEDVTHIAFLANFYPDLNQSGDVVQRTLVLTLEEVRNSVIRLQGFAIAVEPIE